MRPGLERPSNERAIIDVLDRVIDRGIVIDAWLRLSLGGITVCTVESRIVVASIETYLKHASALRETDPWVWSPSSPPKSVIAR